VQSAPLATMRVGIVTLVLAPVLAVTACAGIAPVVDEPLRVGNVADPKPEALGLRAGVTGFDDARDALSARGYTGVVTDAYAPPGGALFGVLAADYQSRVHVFRGGVYDRSIVLPTSGLPPYGMALRIARDGPAVRLLVLYRDPLDRSAFPPTLLSFDWAEDHFELATRTSLDELVSKQEGMTRPLLIGDDLADGILLVARDAGGALWDTSYMVRITGGRAVFEPRPMTDALRCSCVQRYAHGEAMR
jgi:hypothetical protein